MRMNRVWLAMVAICICTMTATPALASGGSINGSVCRAANLNQAFNLSWDHARVWNTSTQQLWVICPVEQKKDFIDNSTTNYWTSSVGYVVAWFGASSASNAEVLCIWREVPAPLTGTVVSNAESKTIISAASRPSVGSQTFAIDPFNDVEAQTVTCRLDPQTGINQIFSVPVVVGTP